MPSAGRQNEEFHPQPLPRLGLVSHTGIGATGVIVSHTSPPPVERAPVTGIGSGGFLLRGFTYLVQMSGFTQGDRIVLLPPMGLVVVPKSLRPDATVTVDPDSTSVSQTSGVSRSVVRTPGPTSVRLFGSGRLGVEPGCRPEHKLQDDTDSVRYFGRRGPQGGSSVSLQ